MAAFIASSARTEQCILTGGRARCLAISEFLISTKPNNLSGKNKSMLVKYEGIVRCEIEGLQL